jgi:transcriptional regulator with XRE-family HTH domain
MIVNDRIKEMRNKYGYTLLQIADRLGVSEATAQRYDSGGIKNIPYAHIEALSEMFNCDPAFLTGWTDRPGHSLSPISVKVARAFETAPQKIKTSIMILLGIMDVKDSDITNDKNA